MKKLFFFKSSTSSNVTNNVASSQSKDNQTCSENLSGDGLQVSRKSRSKKAVYEDQIQSQSQTSLCLRKSRSYSSGNIRESGLLRTQCDSPCNSSSNVSQKQSVSRTYCRALTPERHSRQNWFQDTSTFDESCRPEKSSFYGLDNMSSESSSFSSIKVLDRYIDGEQHQDKSCRQHMDYNTKSQQPNDGGKRPPRFRHGDLTQKPRSHSFRDPKRESKLYMSTRDWVENGLAANGSPRKLAKQVIERLSQSRVFAKEIDHDIPITVEDLYGGSQKNFPRGKETSSYEERNYEFDDNCNKVLEYEETDKTDECTLIRRKLEKEKNELQVELENELDRRSTEWSMRLEKYQTEEHRLRERVRELAEQNVSLQREVSIFREKESENQSKLVHSGQQVKDLTVKMDEIVKENENIRRNLSDVQDDYKAAKEDLDLFKRNYEEKDRECKELHRAVTQFLRTCNEQEKTIEGLREGFSKQAGNFDHNQQSKMQTELLRLTGVEQDLRKEVESYRLEVDSLRHENINLLHRLKGSSNDDGFSTFKLDHELWSRIHCLQNQGTSLINDAADLCSKLIGNYKERVSLLAVENKQGNEALQNGLDSQFIVESDMKLQGLKRESESLTRSLMTVSDVLREKSCQETLDNDRCEDAVKSDLKAEAMMTSLLREKLYSKEVEVERLEAELATAVRGNDVLRCEVQNAMDNLSCVTHRLKDLEMQLIKKDESVYRLTNEVQDCKKELAIVNGILPKVSEERDMMWEEVKKYSENNMLLSCEVEMLKKKVETLDEDVLMKEGQITILKDALGKKPFDLLSSEGFL
ncbi:uncharacterized protein [Rutidosis leptorrhynchoides]|uniref:uncharacterized protein n=1 Tax=Rutidosis leptorrhynchoides TaxID=125765 RepID=UPI003A992ADA